MKYLEFVRDQMKQPDIKRLAPKDRMRAIGEKWRKQGHRGSGIASDAKKTKEIAEIAPSEVGEEVSTGDGLDMEEEAPQPRRLLKGGKMRKQHGGSMNLYGPANEIQIGGNIFGVS